MNYHLHRTENQTNGMTFARKIVNGIDFAEISGKPEVRSRKSKELAQKTDKNR